jgi:hypothetical protein
MSDSTSILDLPTDPVGGGSISNNIVIKANEIPVQTQGQSQGQQMQGQQMQGQSQGQQQGQQNNLNLDQTTINQIVNSLQQASMMGATQLPSRDIPMNTTGLSNDAQIQPNYVPPVPENHVDYIKNYEQTADMINTYNRNNNRQNSLDDMYDELQTPLLIAVLYFLFQLPFFRKFLYGYFPVLFSKDGNYNINGFIFTSILFGLLFYLFNKTTNHFAAF